MLAAKIQRKGKPTIGSAIFFHYEILFAMRCSRTIEKRRFGNLQPSVNLCLVKDTLYIVHDTVV